MRKLGMTAVAAAAIAAVGMATPAEAQRWHRHHHHHHHGWHHHHHHGGIGPAIAGGLALGALAAATAPRCWIEERVVIDRRGRERIRPIQVCW